MFSFIKTTVAGGLLFILPLVLIVALIEKAIHLLSRPVQKVLPMLEHYTAAGVTGLTLLVLLVLVLICFLAGLLARTRLAAQALDTVETKVLGNLPGYQMLKDATARITGLENIDGAKVGLVPDDDSWLICLVLESKGDWVTVYIPDGGPQGATAGELRLMPAAQVRITDLSWLPLLGCLRRGGRGALALMEPWLEKSSTQTRQQEI